MPKVLKKPEFQNLASEEINICTTLKRRWINESEAEQRVVIRPK